MTNLNERTEVARRLRNNAEESPEWIIPWAVFNDAQEHDNIALNNRLADLIDPTCRMEPNYVSRFSDDPQWFTCDKCGNDTEQLENYCPYCGARVVSWND